KGRRQPLGGGDSICEEHWHTAPAEGRWCAGEVVAHLVLVERGVLQSADRLSQKEPKTWPFYRRFHVPLGVVEKRWIRTKSPRAVAPDRLGCKEEMLAELREVRERTFAFLDEPKARDLSAYCWSHPFLGTLDLYEWVCFIASHQIRHTKQMREIAARLPKTVATLRS